MNSAIDCMAVDVHCNNNNHGAGAGYDTHGSSYLGGDFTGHGSLGYGHGVGDVDLGGYGAGAGASHHNSLVDTATDNHIGGIGLSEGELAGHSDLLNGLGGVNGLLSEQGVAKEHAASVGIPFGEGMGIGGHTDFGVNHGIQNGLSAVDHHDDSYINSFTAGQNVGNSGFHGDIGGLDIISGGGGGRHGHGHGHGHHMRRGHHGHLGYGIEDVDTHVENLEEDVQPVMVHNGGHHHHNHHNHHSHGHNQDFEPNFKFHYPTYEIPVHGDVVSEKDAKKIGK